MSCYKLEESRALNARAQVIHLLDEVLSLKGRAQSFTDTTPLLGSVPELDSMAVVAVITALEERLGLSVDDDEISGATFATLGTLVEFVSGKLGA